MKTFTSIAATLAVVGIAGFAIGGALAASSGGSIPRPSAPRPTPTSPSQSAAEDDFGKAEYMIKAGRYDEAIPLLKNVVGKNPNDADAWNYLGFASRHLGKNAEALESYNKALAIDPKHKGAHEYLGELYLQTKQPAKAQEQLVILQGLCSTDCEEVEDLQQAIADYKAANPGAC
jgi:tetratricopeptide (TPR) repeat protein